MSWDNIRDFRQSGMDVRGNLLSRLKWSGILRVWQVDKRWKERIDGKVPYWVIKDEYGATILCWQQLLAEMLRVGERYEMQGDIKIGKGGIFLVLLYATPLKAESYTENEISNECLKQEDEKCEENI